MPAPSNGRQTREPRELRLVSEFLSQYYPHDRTLQQIRVGAVNPRITDQDLTPAEISLLGVHRPRADALVIKNDELLLFEAFILPNLGKLSQLVIYRKLLPNTPELADFADLPVRAFLLGPISHTILLSTAKEFDVGFILYRPQWVVEYLSTLESRHQRHKTYDG